MKSPDEGHPVEVIPDALDGERLDRIVALLGGVSRNRAAAARTYRGPASANMHYT